MTELQNVILAGIALLNLGVLFIAAYYNRRPKPSNSMPSNPATEDKLLELQRQVELMRTKHDQMRLTVADAVDKVERFARRWIKRERDEEEAGNGAEKVTQGTPLTRRQRLQAIRAKYAPATHG